MNDPHIRLYFQYCDKEHWYEGVTCQQCLLTAERDTALDDVANLEFQVAALEEKVRLLEAAL